MRSLAPDLEQLVRRVDLRDPQAARQRLLRLSAGGAELLALVHLADGLGDTLARSPDPDTALLHFERFAHSRGTTWQLFQLLAERPALLSALIQVVSASSYLADVLVRNPEYLELLAHASQPGCRRTLAELQHELASLCAAFSSPTSQLNAVRRYRRRELLRIGCADLHGVLDLAEVTEQLSLLADAVVQQCLAIVAGQGLATTMAILALGKLGGGELNYSSDIDLIFVANRAEQLPSATRVAIDLTRCLSELSDEGFLYRVDLRLRPYGSAGTLVIYPEMLEGYLARQAHPAERQAMLKARPIAGAVDHMESWLARIMPILFTDAADARRHVRHLKDRIEQQLERSGASGENVKLDPGGIRDIEFIAQSLQLESGARNARLHTGNTLTALDRLAEQGLLAGTDAQRLRQAYCFLRTLEHRLQLMNNQQVHHLPADAPTQQVLARSLGFERRDAARQLRERYRGEVAAVREIFQRLLPAAGDGRHVSP